MQGDAVRGRDPGLGPVGIGIGHPGGRRAGGGDGEEGDGENQREQESVHTPFNAAAGKSLHWVGKKGFQGNWRLG